MASKSQDYQGRQKRVDIETADLVEVGLLYMNVYGVSATLSFFRCTPIRQKVYERVIFALRRNCRAGGRGRQKPDG